MKINGIIWLEDIVDKLYYKHNVQQFEVIELLDNNPKFKFVENGFTKGENVYSALGQTYSGRYLIIFFIYKKNNKILIISARDMTLKERRMYERK